MQHGATVATTWSMQLWPAQAVCDDSQNLNEIDSETSSWYWNFFLYQIFSIQNPTESNPLKSNGIYEINSQTLFFKKIASLNHKKIKTEKFCNRNVTLWAQGNSLKNKKHRKDCKTVLVGKKRLYLKKGRF